MSKQTNLFRFEADTPAPSGRFFEPVRRGSDVVGFAGEDDDRGLFYLSERDSEEHRYHNLDAYAVSDSILRWLNDGSVYTVYIAEKDRERVLEYHLKQFLEGYALDHEDAQHAAKVEEALRSWSFSEVEFKRSV